MYGETDMETQIHQLEQEAYSSVLRAFKAQADAITWVLLDILFLEPNIRKFSLSGLNNSYMNLFSSGERKFDNRT